MTDPDEPTDGGREPVPPGVVSSVRGHYQAPALRWVTNVAVAAAAVALVLGDRGTPLAVGAVGLVVATPLARVAWLVHRWRQEHDRRFVRTGLTLLAVVAAGAVLSAIGVGR